MGGLGGGRHTQPSHRCTRTLHTRTGACLHTLCSHARSLGTRTAACTHTRTWPCTHVPRLGAGAGARTQVLTHGCSHTCAHAHPSARAPLRTRTHAVTQSCTAPHHLTPQPPRATGRGRGRAALPPAPRVPWPKECPRERGRGAVPSRPWHRALGAPGPCSSGVAAHGAGAGAPRQEGRLPSAARGLRGGFWKRLGLPRRLGKCCRLRVFSAST